MSSSFYIILPSNTNVEGNKTNTFRVRLPRKLEFNSRWSVGLAVLVYPHSWPQLGTSESQYIRVYWKTGASIKISVPNANFRNPSQLLKGIKDAMDEGHAELFEKLRLLQLRLVKIRNDLKAKAAAEAERLRKDSTYKTKEQLQEEQLAKEDRLQKAIETGRLEPEKQQDLPGNVDEEEIFRNLMNEALAELDQESKNLLDSTKDRGIVAWLEAYRRVWRACWFEFSIDRQKYRFHTDTRFVDRVELSEQLSYCLGFSHPILSKNTEAKFMPDMRGGVSSFLIYAPGLIEPVIFGDVCAPVLRAVTIRGVPDEIIEENYVAIQYHNLLVKEISEIFIEIRTTTTGALMPFEYGTCTLTLHFRKEPYF